MHFILIFWSKAGHSWQVWKKFSSDKANAGMPSTIHYLETSQCIADAIPESCITLQFFFLLTGDKSNGMGCIWFTSRECCSWTWPSPCKLDTKVKLIEIWLFHCEYLYRGPHESTKQSKTSIEERWYRKERGYLRPGSTKFYGTVQMTVFCKINILRWFSRF